jgi:hypothetical protein
LTTDDELIVQQQLIEMLLGVKALWSSEQNLFYWLDNTRVPSRGILTAHNKKSAMKNPVCAQIWRGRKVKASHAMVPVGEQGCLVCALRIRPRQRAGWLRVVFRADATAILQR